MFTVNEANLHKLCERRHCEVLVHHVHVAHENKDAAVQNTYLDDIARTMESWVFLRKTHDSMARADVVEIRILNSFVFVFVRKIHMMHKNLAVSTFIQLM